MILSELEIKHLENILFILKKSKMPDINGEAALIWADSVNFIYAEIQQNKKELNRDKKDDVNKLD